MKRPTCLSNARRRCWLFLVTFTLLASSCGGDDDAAMTDAGEDPDVEMCPSHLRVEALLGRATLDLGSTGVFHSIRIGSYPVTVELTECDERCENCRFEGPREDNTLITRRCLGNTRMTCSSDDDCSGLTEDRCRFLYGQPSSRSFLEDGSCFQFFFLAPEDDASEGQPAVLGRFNLRTGEGNIERLSLGVTVNALGGGVCMECLPSESGERTCQAPRPENLPTGLSVDTQAARMFGGQSCTPGPPSGHKIPGTFSADCPMARPISALALVIDGGVRTAGARAEMTVERPFCSDPAYADQRCWCDVCVSADGAASTRPCGSDTDCESGESCGGAEDCDPNPPPYRLGPDGPELRDDHDPAFRSYQCREPSLSGAGRTSTIPNTCLDECNVEGGANSGTCLSALTGEITSCFPNALGTLIRVPGNVDIRNGEYFVSAGLIECVAPLDSLTGSLFNSSMGLPGLAVHHYEFRISKEFAR